eukprot:14407217-Alexandrium_andersonii.AAC.2
MWDGSKTPQAGDLQSARNGEKAWANICRRAAVLLLFCGPSPQARARNPRAERALANGRTESSCPTCGAAAVGGSPLQE